MSPKSEVPCPKSDGPEREAVLQIRTLSVFAGARQLLRAVNLSIPARQVFGIIGPSGAGKSTLLRCLNRLIELDASLRVEGDILLQGRSIFAPDVDVDALRARVGILFQQPVVFPVSIYKNVLFGARHLGRVARAEWPALAERALREAALWDEVKDRLHEPGATLSVGQQQRLCLARTLAVNPEIILMDEPTSALDAKSTEAIEDLILRLKATRTIVLDTAGFKFGIDPWEKSEWRNRFESGVDGHFAPGDAGSTVFHAKFATQPRPNWPALGLGVANLAVTEDDRTRGGQPFTYAVLSYDLSPVPLHGGYGLQTHHKNSALLGVDKSFKLFHRDLVLRADAIQIERQHNWAASVGGLYSLHKTFVIESWMTQPIHGSPPSFTLKFNLVIQF